jgi:hypothetical protein
MSDISDLQVTPELREVLKALQEKLNFPTMTAVRDYAVSHAIRKGLKPRSFSNLENVWGVHGCDSELLKAVKWAFPDEEEIYRIYQNLYLVGLEDLRGDENFEVWSTVGDLPGMSDDE